MIIVFEGTEFSGKSSLIRKLKETIKFPIKVYRTWRYSEPTFKDSPFCNKSFEEVVVADLLFSNKLDHDLIIDRSMISGYVYHKYGIENRLNPDFTFDDRYLDYWLRCLHCGENGPLVLVHVKVSDGVAELRRASLSKNVYGFEKIYDGIDLSKLNISLYKNVSIIYNNFFNERSAEFNNIGVTLITLINNTMCDFDNNIEELERIITDKKSRCKNDKK